MLCRYRSGPSPVISPAEVEIQPDMTYNEEPIKILRNKSIALVKYFGNGTVSKRLRGSPRKL
ncbi:receptor-like protein kinase [Gossypium australe]|uniref:Receptor-like protein kinase n=1 Tax=Gossypium australe TaxID=47621 RepID=A0A5B6VP94_9ROSI|nr:receptor-like protein kinase [Gossypium australe]